MPDTSPDPARIAAQQQLGYAMWAFRQAGCVVAESSSAEDNAYMRGLAGERPACGLAELPDWVLLALLGGPPQSIVEDTIYLRRRYRVLENRIRQDAAAESWAALRAALATPPSGDGG